LGTPHRSESIDDLEDQLYKLVLLPGPEPIADGVLRKVKELARQVTKTNQRFLATKLPDRAAIINLFTQVVCKNQKQSPVAEDGAGPAAPNPNDNDQGDNLADPVTPFPQYAHYIGHSFEAAGKIPIEDVDHLALVNGGLSGEWLSSLSRSVFSLRDGFRKSSIQDFED
jgi:hypothetical protein